MGIGIGNVFEHDFDSIIDENGRIGTICKKCATMRFNLDIYVGGMMIHGYQFPPCDIKEHANIDWRKNVKLRTEQ